MAMPAMIHPGSPPEDASAAGLIEGFGAALVGIALVGIALVGAGDAELGWGAELVGVAPAYENVIPPSTGWPSWETTR